MYPLGDFFSCGCLMYGIAFHTSLIYQGNDTTPSSNVFRSQVSLFSDHLTTVGDPLIFGLPASGILWLCCPEIVQAIFTLSPPFLILFCCWARMVVPTVPFHRLVATLHSPENHKEGSCLSGSSFPFGQAARMGCSQKGLASVQAHVGSLLTTTTIYWVTGVSPCNSNSLLAVFLDLSLWFLRPCMACWRALSLSSRNETIHVHTDFFPTSPAFFLGQTLGASDFLKQCMKKHIAQKDGHPLTQFILVHSSSVCTLPSRVY